MIVSITTQIPGYEPRYQHVPVNAAHAYMASVGINRSTAQAMLKALARTGNPQTRTLKSGSTVHVAHVRQEGA